MNSYWQTMLALNNMNIANHAASQIKGSPESTMAAIYTLLGLVVICIAFFAWVCWSDLKPRMTMHDEWEAVRRKQKQEPPPDTEGEDEPSRHTTCLGIAGTALGMVGLLTEITKGENNGKNNQS